jgi:hypothetical protein
VPLPAPVGSFRIRTVSFGVSNIVTKEPVQCHLKSSGASDRDFGRVCGRRLHKKEVLEICLPRTDQDGVDYAPPFL